MLQRVDVGRRSVDSYQESAGGEVVEWLKVLAEPLRGLRLLHVNATPYGGGVAEILRAEIPLLRDLGIEADWRIITGGEAFFRTTKAIHNGLQGAKADLTNRDREVYVEYAKRNAQLLENEYDLLFIHDPQPAGMLEYHGRGRGKWIWRCHIDTSQPNWNVWEFIRPFVAEYDAAVFTLGGFVPPDLPIERVEIIPPAIDPLSPKNLELTNGLANSVLDRCPHRASSDVPGEPIRSVERSDGGDPRVPACQGGDPGLAARARRFDGARRPGGLGHLQSDPRGG
jgi:trehalose synthase